MGPLASLRPMCHISCPVLEYQASKPLVCLLYNPFLTSYYVFRPYTRVRSHQVFPGLKVKKSRPFTSTFDYPGLR